MFDGLDDIDWASFGTHIATGRQSKDIPQFVRNMLSDDAETREYAIMDLFGEGQHNGMLDDATPYIIPFVLEVLEKEDYPNKPYILASLASVSHHILMVKTIPSMRFALSVYEVLESGMSLYLKYLHDADKDTRQTSTYLVSYLQGKAKPVLDALMARYKVETEVEIRVEIVEAMHRLMLKGQLYYAEEFKPHREFIQMLVMDGETVADRVAAAQNLVLVDYIRDETLSQQVVAVLIEGIKTAQEDYKKRWLARSLCNVKAAYLLPHLTKELTPEEAHLVGRAVLCSHYVMWPYHEEHWQMSPQHNQPGYVYGFYTLNARLKLFGEYDVMEQVANYDPFWQMPTTLFSRFYGLPDERSELQEAIKIKKADNDSDIQE